MLVVILDTILLVELLFVLHTHFKLVERLSEHGVRRNFHWCAWVVCHARFAHFHIRVGFSGRWLGVVVGVRGLTYSISASIRSAILASQLGVQANADAGRRAPQPDIDIIQFVKTLV